MDIELLDLPPRIYTALRKARLETAQQILHHSASELASITRLQLPDTQALLLRISKLLYPPKPLTALTLRKINNIRLPPGDPILASVLNGGLPPGLTEIYGRSATGKTQFALQLCIMACLPTRLGGLGSGCLYIATEQPFPIARYHSMISSRGYPMSVLDNTHIIHIRDQETQQHVLLYHLGPAIERLRIRLIVVDSIAANFRGDELASTWDAKERAKVLHELGGALRKVADEFGCVVVCINQVTDVFDRGVQSSVGGIRGGDPFVKVTTAPVVEVGKKDKVMPSLGLAWSNNVNTRIEFSRIDRLSQMEDICPMDAETAARNVTRTMRIRLASHLPPVSCEFVIRTEGLHAAQSSIVP